MSAYIRFQTQLRCGTTGRPAGVFLAAGKIEDNASTPGLTKGRLRVALEWFNQNLTVPKLESGDWRCLFWFRNDAQYFIRALWDLVYLLEDEGVFVTKLHTSSPGRIVYSDPYQVAAIPPRKRVRRR